MLKLDAANGMQISKLDLDDLISGMQHAIPNNAHRTPNLARCLCYDSQDRQSIIVCIQIDTRMPVHVLSS